MANSKTKVITGIVRLSYANVWEPKSINGGAEKYSVLMLQIWLIIQRRQKRNFILTFCICCQKL